jgi:hypothetical protein
VEERETFSFLSAGLSFAGSGALCPLAEPLRLCGVEAFAFADFAI